MFIYPVSPCKGHNGCQGFSVIFLLNGELKQPQKRQKSRGSSRVEGNVAPVAWLPSCRAYCYLHGITFSILQLRHLSCQSSPGARAGEVGWVIYGWRGSWAKPRSPPQGSLVPRFLPKMAETSRGNCPVGIATAGWFEGEFLQGAFHSGGPDSMFSGQKRAPFLNSQWIGCFLIGFCNAVTLSQNPAYPPWDPQYMWHRGLQLASIDNCVGRIETIHRTLTCHELDTNWELLGVNWNLWKIPCYINKGKKTVSQNSIKSPEVHG